MKECDNTKIHISSSFLLSICILIMFDTLLLVPSLHCVFVVDCRKGGLIQEKTNSIFNQRRQNDWSKKSIYSLKPFPQHMKQITKCYAFPTYVVVENIENLRR